MTGLGKIGALGRGLGLTLIKGGVDIITSIFADGTDGFYYDFSVLSKLWQDTSATSAVTTDGHTIARVDDSSARGNNATQSTSGSRPAYKTGGLSRYDGTADCLITTVVPATAITLMFKAKLSGTLAAQAFLTGSRTTGTNDRFYLGYDTDEQLICTVGSTTVTRVGSVSDTVGVAGLVLSGGNATLYWNAVAGTPGAVGAPNTTWAIPIGAINISGTVQSFFPGDIYHALGIKKALTAGQIASITTKWGTS